MTKSIAGGIHPKLSAPAFSRNSAKVWRRFGGVSTAALALAMSGSAFAQAVSTATPAPAGAPDAPAKPGTELQTVVVTGSRIARRDYTSESPIVTLSAQTLTQQADLQIQNILNKLPEFSPDKNLMGQSAGDVQPTPTNSIGITTASLRGLGPNRNLVLIDGQRAAPVNGELVIDLSTIPTAMIDHVEAITGGASAVYGADAIGGVVNFIMKKNFHGLDLDLQEGINQTGDGKQFSGSVVMGTNFADDKGNITTAIERYTSDASLEKDHRFYSKRWSDPTTTGSGFFPFGAASNPSPSAAAVAQANLNAPPFSYFWINNGQVWTGAAGFGPTVPISGTPPTVNGSTYAYQNVVSNGTVIKNIKSNETVGYVQAPLDRWSMMTNGHYDINEWVTATFNANFSQTHVSTLLTAPASFISGWTVNVPYDAATNGVASNHAVPGQLATLLNSRNGGVDTLYCLKGSVGCAAAGPQVTTDANLVGKVQAGPNAPWTLSWLPSINGPLAPRGTEDTNTVYQIRAGLKGKFPKLEGWNWEVNGSHSESMEYVVAAGDYSLQRFQALITAPNYGANSTFKGNSTQPNGAGGTIPNPNANFGTGAGASCTSGFYNALFNGAAISKDCAYALNAPLQSMDITKQDVVEYDMSGDLFKLPAGVVKASFGADYRRDQLVYNPDILQTNASFIDQTVGVYPTDPINVSQDVKEGYGELSIPVLADLPFIKAFTINPGLRYSSYNTSKGGYTYKILGDFEVNDYVRLRGGYNVATRAPNLGELFQGPTELFSGSVLTYGDPCSLLSTSPSGAGGAAVAQGQTVATPVANKGGAAAAANAYAVCRALMNKAGLGSAPAYYDTPGTLQPNPGPAALSFTNQFGDPNLLPETAKTYTAGIVLKSPFQNPLFNRANLSIDYYRIHIDNAIEYASVDYVYQNCLNQPVATALNSIYCQAITRNPVNGSAALTSTPSTNLGTIDTSGVDVQADWSVALSDIKKDVPGRFSVSVVASFLGNFDTILAPGAPVQKWYGTLGPTLAGTNGGSYAYKLNTSFVYTFGPGMINLNWRHLPQVNSTSSIAPGNVTLPTSAYDIFDLNTNWNLPHAMQLRFGIQNLLDVDPPTTGATKANFVNGIQTSVANSGQGTTNSGYYDPLGRRFYVGLKARF